MLGALTRGAMSLAFIAGIAYIFWLTLVALRRTRK